MKRRGMALLMTLTILLVLSLALTKSFEDRALEQRHLSASLAQFQLENLARSVVRGLIQAFRVHGFWEVTRSKQGLALIPAGAVVPLGEAGISDISITSLDHLFNLKNRFKPLSVQAKVFDKTLTSIYAARQTQSFGVNPEEVMSALNDFQDPDSDPDEYFPYGAEQYPQAHPAFKVKNAPFDLLSEVKVLPAFALLGLSQKELEDHFRVSGPLESRLDVNMAKPEEIAAFLDQWSGLGEPYQNLERLKAPLLEILSQKDKNGFQPFFDEPFVSRGNSVFEQELEARGLMGQISAAELDLFSGVTKLALIRFTLHQGPRTKRVRVLVEFSYAIKLPGKRLPKATGAVIHEMQIY
ncbi:MAG: hypothetical protein A2508_07085 [Candidatus Lambdaproteobacteria bacterium RIFOXYD12_FULL_49_8]|uniref:Type II secretion system protein K n=1 Tax=Candidatus Lambdaproteobacteria bacterium RIFOXYD2_FULL_50_16 TaxID=1817772 RepID=A0A1F6GFZ7_9PROT|nr:MAG: hypothetical protein A2527_02875 [Candidatus Lambdaproteobacteria bacterium RIFOXYD2_FULL_50_16]OGG97436.1 MAG: hypothetical protein A2508_07085 [Candidatus Lambdaproteobacteria bacterium RIFOXYD12_FULL_49_8]